jgi:hypothetical protein
MLDEEFDRQYKAATERGQAQRAKLLIERANRLKFFVDTFGGRSNCCIEVSAYLVLEAYQSRRAAIWGYFCHGVRGWVRGLRFEWRLKCRVWRYRLSGNSRQSATEMAYSDLETALDAEK